MSDSRSQEKRLAAQKGGQPVSEPSEVKYAVPKFKAGDEVLVPARILQYDNVDGVIWYDVAISDDVKESDVVLRDTVGPLESALEKLANKLEIIAADSEYQSVCFVAQIHRGNYRGPTWEAELAEAKAALQRFREGSK